MADSEDEFADLPDIVDFSIMCTQEHTGGATTDSQDEFAQYDLFNEHDPYADIDLDAIPGLGAPIQGGSETRERDNTGMQVPEAPSQSPPDTSTQYSFDELDDAALKELDEIEARETRAPLPTSDATVLPAIGETVARTSTSLQTEVQPSPCSSVKRKRSHEVVPASKRAKMRKRSQDPNASARNVLSNIEGSVTCSICYEIFSEPHVCSPCGHSYCAECVVDWMNKNVHKAPKCPFCRITLTQGTLVAPNFGLKDVVEKYVAALAESGFVDWQSQGQKLIDWRARNVRWSKLVPILRDLQRRRWDEGDEAPPGSVHQAEVQQTNPFAVDLSEDESSDDEVDWPPTQSRVQL